MKKTGQLIIEEDLAGSWCLHLFQLDLRVDVDVADLAVEGFVLQAGALRRGAAAVLQLGSGSGVSLDGPRSASGFQHGLVLGTWEESSRLWLEEAERFSCAHRGKPDSQTSTF